jgi:hypothetical protein
MNSFMASGREMFMVLMVMTVAGLAKLARRVHTAFAQPLRLHARTVSKFL